MKKFFKVKTINDVLSMSKLFKKKDKESILIEKSLNRILAENIYSDIDIPDFNRSTMDGFAIKASSSFGSSEINPTYLNIKGTVRMGALPNFSIYADEAAKIPTGGALPKGTDSVIMLEHSNIINETSIEIYKSIAPGNNIILKGEDVKKGEISISSGIKIRPQEMGLIAASGKETIKVFKKPTVSIISTGNEIIPAHHKPKKGQVRDINSYSLYGQIVDAGGIPKTYMIVPDEYYLLKKACTTAIKNSDITIISGGSSIGTKDLTLDVIESIKNTQLLVHGISISPGKPTILAKLNNKQIWGLPGHAASAMVVFKIFVKTFLEQIAGKSSNNQIIPTKNAILNRNIASSNGRTDYIRVKLKQKGKTTIAEPIIGKSGLINTMVMADGLIKIDINTEGLCKDTSVEVILI